MFWRWLAYARDQCPRGKQPLLLNVDETAVRYVPKSPPGSICPPEFWPSLLLRPCSLAKKGELRGCFTYIGVICNQSDIQGHLPHIIIANKSHLKAAECQRIQAGLKRI